MLDAHAHLADQRFSSDLDDVLARAAGAGVRTILTCAEDLDSSERSIALAARHSSVRVAVGVHPHRAASWDAESAQRLERLTASAFVVAIGEIGLDLSGRSAPLGEQVEVFRRQVEAARRLDLPVLVHVRDSGELARRLLDEVSGLRGMVHCFSEGPAEVGEWTRRGFFVSFAGTLTYPSNERLREAARAAPAERLLVETDAPYLAPQAHRGSRNEPAFVVETLAALAAARGEAVAGLAGRVRANAAALFGALWQADGT